MAKIHVLTAGAQANLYTVVVHDTTPAGNNSAGVAWSDAVKNSGLAATSMQEGTGAGQITTAEKASVLAGTTLEATFTFQDDPSWTTNQRNTALDAKATAAIAQMEAELARVLKWFGATRN